MSREFLTHFTFDNYKCNCAIEKVADDNSGALIKRLAIKKVVSKRIPMAYFYGDGLKIIDSDTKSKNNILGEFLGIKKDDLNSYKSFFEKYGFLFDLENEKFNTIPIDKIHELKSNLLAFVFLINNQLDSYSYYRENNVKELLDATLYLLFKKEFDLVIAGITVFRVKKNEVMKIIENANFHDELSHNRKPKKVDGQIIEYFDIEDSLMDGGLNIIDVETFNGLLKKDYPQWFTSLCRVYKNKNQFFEDKKYHIIVDFLYHFATNLYVFSKYDISLDGSFQDDIYANLMTNTNLLNALIKVSKIILEDEFKANLSQVTPIFNVTDMKPDWRLPSLYTALYFSLFYMNSKEDSIRKCANRNCNEFFQVSKTNSKKKYCSILCCNSVSQRNYQQKQILKKK